MFLIFSPSLLLAPISSLSKSPVDICGIPYFSIKILDCVPLPQPGAPKKSMFIVSPLLDYKSGAMTRLTIAMTFIRIFMEGPEVSFNGSPTVSPTTAAL